MMFRWLGWLQLDLLGRDEEGVYRADSFNELAWLRHGFGTRLSSKQNPKWPESAAVPLAAVKQIHSDRVLVVQSPGPQGEGDAMITKAPGIGLTIRTADCLPILIADTKNHAVAAIHAGWRGVVSEIGPKTIEAMQREFGSQPEDLLVAIGPGIGPCCFEVGPEVSVQFGLTGRTKIDLLETMCRQLGRNGVKDRQISSSGLCSFCDAEKFESYRRDRERSGRMTALISILHA